MPKFLSPNLRDTIAAHNLDIVSAAKVDITDEMMVLAHQLSRIHGRIRVTNEASGIQFYMPSPICLAEYGPDELYKMHLAVNPQKYLDGQDCCACCMKTSTAYRMSDLLSMPPLSERYPEVKPEVIKVARVAIESMEQDANGAWIPKGPGTVVPVYKLPSYHPAQVYLRSRNFDAEMLWEQFRLSYCVAERKDIFYGRMLNGFRKTPQGRIIFHIDIGGICRGWQSRILDMEKDGVRSYYHPYSKRWVPVLKKIDGKWLPIDERWTGWDDAKYLISAGCRRNECLLGFDAAVAWNKANDDGKGYWCVLAEGGLDAGRIGPPGMAIMGKSFSEKQCQLAAFTFRKLIYVADDDEAGRQATQNVTKRFAGLTGPMSQTKVRIVFPPSGKDLGDMAPEAAEQFIWGEYAKF